MTDLSITIATMTDLGVAILAQPAIQVELGGDGGANGTNGTNGTNGADGADGADGIQGIQGIQGINGADGADGAGFTNGAATDDIKIWDGAAWANSQELKDARGDRSTLGLRIANLSNFASPNAGGNIIGQYYDNSFHGTASATGAGAAGRMELVPFFTSQRMRIDQLGVAVSTAIAAAQGRLVIYNSDVNGWPDELVLEGGAALDFATTGYKSHSVDFTFDSGRQYWLGVHFSSTATIRCVNLASAVNLGINGSAGTQYFTALRRTVTFGAALPDPWAFVTGDRVANISPASLRFRLQALP